VDDYLVYCALEETGTVDTSFLCNNCENNGQSALVEQQERNRVMELSVPEKVLQVHKVAPASKLEGVIWLINKDVNGICNRLSKNDKVEKANKIHDKLEDNIVAYNKHRLNLQDRQKVNGFHQLFKWGEVAIQSVVVHNIHENIGCVQEGGTNLMAFESTTEYCIHDQPGKDKTGLGCWSVMTFKGENALTRMVYGYDPCYNAKPDSSTTYQQHRRYFITQRKDLTCPGVKFQEDLVAQLSKWRGQKAIG
jgi:hypothetical protein